MSKYKWCIPMLVGLIMFGNHYTRDSVGALEKQLEHNLKMSSNSYLDLNAIYFFPNILTPLLAGLVIDRLGGTAVCYLYSTCLASLGFVIFACE